MAMLTMTSPYKPLAVLVVILLAAHFASLAPTHTTRDSQTPVPYAATHRPTSQPSWHLLLALWRPKETAAPTTHEASSTLSSPGSSLAALSGHHQAQRPGAHATALTASDDLQADDPENQDTGARPPRVTQEDTDNPDSPKLNSDSPKRDNHQETEHNSPISTQQAPHSNSDDTDDAIDNLGPGKWMNQHVASEHVDGQQSSEAQEDISPQPATQQTSTSERENTAGGDEDSLLTRTPHDAAKPAHPSATTKQEGQEDYEGVLHPAMIGEKVQTHSLSSSSTGEDQLDTSAEEDDDPPESPELDDHFFVHPFPHHREVMHLQEGEQQHITTNPGAGSHYPKTTMTVPGDDGSHYPRNSTNHSETAPHSPMISTDHFDETASHSSNTNITYHETAPHHPQISMTHLGTASNNANTTTTHHESAPHHPQLSMTHLATAPHNANTTTTHHETALHHPMISTSNSETVSHNSSTSTAHHETGPHHPKFPMTHPGTPSDNVNTTTTHHETTPHHPKFPMTHTGTASDILTTTIVPRTGSDQQQEEGHESLSEAGQDKASHNQTTNDKATIPVSRSNRGEKVLEFQGPVVIEPLDEPSLVPLVAESKEILTMKDDESAVLAILRVAQGSSNLEDQFQVNSMMQSGETSALQPEIPSLVQPMDHSIVQPIDYSIVQPVDHSVVQPIDHGVVQPVDHTAMQPENSANPDQQLASTIISSHRFVTSGPDDVPTSQRSNKAKLVPTAILIKKGTKVLDSRKSVNALDSRDKSGEVVRTPDETSELQNTAKPIYEEISDTLKVDTSIDDVEDFDLQAARHTENTDEFLPPTNQSHTNLIDITLYHPNSTPTTATDTPPLPSTTTTTTTSPQSPTPHTYSDYPSHYPPKFSQSSDIHDPTTTTATEEGEVWSAFIGNISSLSGAGLSLNESMLQRTLELGLEEHYRMVLQERGSLMLQLMDPSTDPCEDFYQFACGKWNGKFPIRQDKAVDNTFERLKEDLDEVLRSLLEEPPADTDNNITKAVKTLYTGCMDTDAIEEMGAQPLLDLLKELGGWPVLEGEDWDDSNYDWVQQMAKLRNYNNDILVSEWVAADITNSSNHIIQLDQPELGLPGREYFINPGDYLYRQAYMNLMVRVTQLLGAPLTTSLTDMTDVLHFEKQVSRILTAAEERRNLSAVHRRMTLQELHAEVPEIDWMNYLELITWNNTQTEDVVVFGLDYFKKLVALMKDTQNRTISNYLLWRFVKNRISNLGEKYTTVKQDYIKVLFGRKSQPERWRSCVTYVSGNLGYVVGAMFVKRYFPEASKNDTDEMIRLIRGSFRMALDDARWMHGETRKVAQQKVDTIVKNVGYPEYLLNDTYMDLVYTELGFNPDTHFENVLKMLQFHARTNHNLLSVPVNRTAWVTSPAVVNAYYSRSKNMIVFPAGILQPPFYHPAFPRSLNYGGIGVVIGHEISHGFDDRGRQFDKNGNLQQWWKPEDVSKFYQRASCMLDQYGEYKVDEVGLKINPVNTLGENIADNAGIKISYQAYKTWRQSHEEEVTVPYVNLTHDQLFFLNFGQIWCEVNSPEAMLTKLRIGQHSPNKFRVIGTLSNSEEFSEAFNCPVGSRMNPERKCRVW